MKHSTNRKMKLLRSRIFSHEKEEVKKTKISLGETSKGSGFSGSSYNAKGSVDHGKIKSNKKRR